MELHILKSQANEVFQAIRDIGLEPSDFDWVEGQGHYSGRPASRLTFNETKYYFEFDNSKAFFSEMSPGQEVVKDHTSAINWPAQLTTVKHWLGNLKKETESPDLWGAISTEAQILESAASESTSNAPFTEDEKTYIVQGINEIRQFLLTAHKLDPELVESRLKYLVESSERMGRKDWINILVSVLVGIVIDAALPPETTRELFRFVGTVLKQIIRQPLLLT